MAQHAIAGSAQINPKQSFADIARISPTEEPNGSVRRPEAGAITCASAFIPWREPVLHDRYLRSGQRWQRQGADRRGPTGYRSRCEDKKEGREMEVGSGDQRARCPNTVKAYGSMVTYVMKENNASRLFEDN
ncbi:hypothetical protein FOTG_19246 [Fusarium oxysporum f. sp. vasinfectum 25433]|uniref:Uncharacterized protein n=1 Tax=Fusarium oxysporum f. sp. vasinfectum 25433 TaxID=1089449 RepID=X0KFG4_FUSOX|nr:hypothetical protein FOTG_19246 [Fusarium oxysporum f. sp. vasinfectum 25433]